MNTIKFPYILTGFHSTMLCIKRIPLISFKFFFYCYTRFVILFDGTWMDYVGTEKGYWALNMYERRIRIKKDQNKTQNWWNLRSTACRNIGDFSQQNIGISPGRHEKECDVPKNGFVLTAAVRKAWLPYSSVYQKSSWHQTAPQWESCFEQFASCIA